MLGKIEGRKRRWQKMRWLDDITDSTVMNLGKLRDGEGQGGLARCSPWGHKESDMTEWLNNSTTGNPDSNSPWKSPLRSRDCWDGMEPPRLQTEKAMASYSSTLAWKIPWMEEPGRLQSVGSLGVGHNWATSLSLFTFMHWRRKWQPTPVFLPGESQGWGSLVGCCLWGRTELDTTEAT